MSRFLTKEEIDNIELKGSNIIVERYLPPEKMTPDSLIILPRDFMMFKGEAMQMTSVHDNPRMKVIRVGPGELLDSGEIEEVNVEVGDIVIGDSHLTDERNKIGDSPEGGYFVIHCKLAETAVYEDVLQEIE